MSILIRKMEMPKGCWACPFAVGKHYECLFTKKSYNWGLTTRPSDCPLIEVKLVAQEELITPLNMIGGYLEKAEGSDT